MASEWRWRLVKGDRRTQWANDEHNGQTEDEHNAQTITTRRWKRWRLLVRNDEHAQIEETTATCELRTQRADEREAMGCKRR
uniref:Uncharacterized protein n=1 Tax=Cucumis melo TaxID=3656 RepID=A0A9I9CIB3_CUCME